MADDSRVTAPPLLEVDDLRVEFRTPTGTVHAVNGVSFSLSAGETLAVLGESGSGKSVMAQALLGVIDSPPGRIAGGSVRYRGIDLLSLSEAGWRKYRGQHIAMVFQDALTALTPVFSVGAQITEMLRQHTRMSRAEARERAVELLDQVGIPNARARFDSYPHQFSGGMRQRAMIAMAIALNPDILIADEPTTALDVTIQAQILELLSEISSARGMAVVLITHDLAVVKQVADRVAVMYAGRVVEELPARDLFDRPSHPYTLGLTRSIPRASETRERLSPIPGSPPDLRFIPDGCAFHPRCELRGPRCDSERPPIREVSESQRSACHYFEKLLVAEAGRT